MEPIRAADPFAIESKLCWGVLEKLFEEQSYSSCQIGSFNHFIEHTIKTEFTELPIITHRCEIPTNPRYGEVHKLYVENVTVAFPRLPENDGVGLTRNTSTTKRGPGQNLPVRTDTSTGDQSYNTPSMSRKRNLTYSSQVRMDIVHRYHKADDAIGQHLVETRYPNLLLCEVPVMVGSVLDVVRGDSHADECPHDRGGFFIIEGVEKVLIGQERMRLNSTFVFCKKVSHSKETLGAEIRCNPEGMSKPASTIYIKRKCHFETDSVASEINATWPASVLFDSPSADPKRRQVLIPDESGKDFVCRNVRVQSEAFFCVLPYIKCPIPLGILFAAMGVTTDRDIAEQIVIDMDDSEMLALLTPIFTDSDYLSIKSREEALAYISSKSASTNQNKDHAEKYARELIARDVFSHINDSSEPESVIVTRKARFLGLFTHKLLRVSLKRTPISERDEGSQKRGVFAGLLMSSLYYHLIKRSFKEMRTNLVKQLDSNASLNIHTQNKHKSATQGMNYAIKCGNWIVSRSPSNWTGVSATLNRQCMGSVISNTCRLNTPIQHEGKLLKPRQLLNGHWARTCAAQTPESQSCGLTKNLASTARVTIGDFSHPIVFALRQDPSFHHLDALEAMAKARAAPLRKHTKVIVNGRWEGVAVSAQHIFDMLVGMKRHLDLNPETGIVWDRQEREIRICTDAGRIQRPLLVVGESGHLIATRERLMQLIGSRPAKTDFNDWTALLLEGVVEYMDVEEESFRMVAMYPEDLANDIRHQPDDLPEVEKGAYMKRHPRYTHCEIRPAIYGIMASTVPFMNHNPASRNSFQSAMGQQVVGVPGLNYQIRFDTVQHVLHYPQKPLIYTNTTSMNEMDMLPGGINLMVAVMNFEGFNQEDASIVNTSSIDRGLYMSTFFRSIRDEEKRQGNHHYEAFEVPNQETCQNYKKSADYSKLDEDGFARVGARVGDRDVIIGKTSTITTKGSSTDNFTHRDHSTYNRTGEPGVVDAVQLTVNAAGNRIVKIKVRSVRRPGIGDKFSFRHGQKGVFGMGYRQEDMPFCAAGTPDLIINPGAFTNRKTVGMLLEMLAGKLGAAVGKRFDASPFEKDFSMQKIQELLTEAGIEPRGNEQFYHPFTGLPIEGQVFYAPCYQQRLRHMVADKIHSRDKGPRNILTRQPADGRMRNGGYRFGEMERDCTLSHGASSVLQSRLFELSDYSEEDVCGNCGKIAYTRKLLGVPTCNFCNSSDNIMRVPIPHATFLLFQEMNAMGISTRIYTAPRVAKDPVVNTISNVQTSKSMVPSVFADFERVGTKGSFIKPYSYDTNPFLVDAEITPADALPSNRQGKRRREEDVEDDEKAGGESSRTRGSSSSR